jgi:threonine dehydratase
MALSWRAARSISAPCSSIAGGIAIETPFAAAIARLQSGVDDVLLVEDSILIDAMKMAHRKLGLVLEPSGAAGLAAIMANRGMFEGTTVAVVLTGGNLSEEEIAAWLS